MRKQKTTEEEKVALKLTTLVSDLRIDLEMVGKYLSYLAPNVSLRRLSEIVEAAKYEKEDRNGRKRINELY